jgi:hypothetical protein
VPVAEAKSPSKWTTFSQRVRDKLYHEGFGGIRIPDGLDPRTSAVIVDGAFVEIKIVSPSASGVWTVNLHRRGKLNERGVDAYVFLLQNVPGNGPQPLYVVFRAPLGRTTLKLSVRSLIRLYAAHIEDWPTLREICDDNPHQP